MTKILYVEDNADNIYMLTRRLKKKGFDIIIAGDGQEGIDKAIEESPDLILMDLSLPTMDGWTAAIHSARSTEEPQSARAWTLVAQSFSSVWRYPHW